MADEDKKKEETKIEEKSEEQPVETKPEAPTPPGVGVPTESVEKKAVEKPVEEKVEEKVEDKPKEKPAPTGKFKDLIKEIEGLSVADLAELVKVLEERFGVSAAAPVAASAASANGTPAGGAAPAEEKANYTVVLAASGEQKINVIKAIREINQNLGLKEAKDLADNPPKEIKKDVPKAEAEEAKKKLEAVGAKVELK